MKTRSMICALALVLCACGGKLVPEGEEAASVTTCPGEPEDAGTFAPFIGAWTCKATITATTSNPNTTVIPVTNTFPMTIDVDDAGALAMTLGNFEANDPCVDMQLSVVGGVASLVGQYGCGDAFPGQQITVIEDTFTLADCAASLHVVTDVPAPAGAPAVEASVATATGTCSRD